MTHFDFFVARPSSGQKRRLYGKEAEAAWEVKRRQRLAKELAAGTACCTVQQWEIDRFWDKSKKPEATPRRTKWPGAQARRAY